MKMDNFGGNTQLIEWLSSKDSWRPFLSRISNQLKEIVGTQEAHRRGMMQLSHKTVVNLKKCHVPYKKCRPLKRRRLRILSDSESDDEIPQQVPAMMSNPEIVENIVIESDLPKTEPIVVNLIDSDSERDLLLKNEKRALRKRHFEELFGSDSDDETTSSVFKEKIEQHDGKVFCQCLECINDQSTGLTRCDSALATEESVMKSETIVYKSDIVHPGGKTDCDPNVINSITQPIVCALANEEPVLKNKVTVTSEVTLEIEESHVSPTEEPDSSTLPRDASVASETSVLENSENEVGKSVDKNDFVSSSGLPASPLDNSSVTSRPALIRVRDYRSLGISDNWSASAEESASNSPPVTAASAKPVSCNTPGAANVKLLEQIYCVRMYQKVLHLLPEKCRVNLAETSVRLEYLFREFVSFLKEQDEMRRSHISMKSVITEIIQTKYNRLREEFKKIRSHVKILLENIQEYITDNKPLMYAIILCGLLLQNRESVYVSIVKFISIIFQEPSLVLYIKSAATETYHLTTSNGCEGIGNLSWHTISDSLSVDSSSSVNSSAVSSQKDIAPGVPLRPNINVSEPQINKQPEPTPVTSNSSLELFSGIHEQRQSQPMQHLFHSQSTEVTTPVCFSQSFSMGPPPCPPKQGITLRTQSVLSHPQTNVDNHLLQQMGIRESTANGGSVDVQRSVTVRNTQQSMGPTKGSCEQQRMPNLTLGSSYKVSSRLQQNLRPPLPSKQKESGNTAKMSAYISAQLPSSISLPHQIQEPNQTVTGHCVVTAVESHNQQKRSKQALYITSNVLETQSHTPYITLQERAACPPHLFQSQQLLNKVNELAPNQQSPTQQSTYQQPAFQQESCQQNQALYQSTQAYKMYSSNSEHGLPQAKSRFPQQSESNSFAQSHDAHHGPRQYSQTQVPNQQTQLLNQGNQTQIPYRGNQYELASNQQIQTQKSIPYYQNKVPSVPHEQPKMTSTKTHQSQFLSALSEISMRPVNQRSYEKTLRHGPEATSAGVRVASVRPIVATVNQSHVSAAQPTYVLARPTPALAALAPDQSVKASQTCAAQDRAKLYSAPTSIASQIPSFQSHIAFAPSAQMRRTQGVTKIPAQSYGNQAATNSYQAPASASIIQQRSQFKVHRAQAQSVTNEAQAQLRSTQDITGVYRAQAPAQFCYIQAPRGHSCAPSSEDFQTQYPTAQLHTSQAHKIQSRLSHAAQLKGAHSRSDQTHQNKGFTDEAYQCQGPSDQTRRAQGLTDQTQQTQGLTDQTQGPIEQTRRAQGLFDQTQQAQDLAHRAQGFTDQAHLAQGRTNQAHRDHGLSVQTNHAQGLSAQAHAQGLRDQSYRTNSPPRTGPQTSLSVPPPSVSNQTQEPSSAGFRAHNPFVTSVRTLTDPAWTRSSETLASQHLLAVTQHEQSQLGGTQTLLKQPVQSKQEQLVQRQSTLCSLLRAPNPKENERNKDCEQNGESAKMLSNCAKQSQINVSLAPCVSSGFLGVNSPRIIPRHCEDNSKKDKCYQRHEGDNNEAGSCMSAFTNSSESIYSVPSSQSSEITLASILNKTVVSLSVEQSSNAIETTNSQLSVLGSSEQLSTNSKLGDISVSPVQMLCSKQLSQLAVETPTVLSSKSEGLHCPQSSVSVQLQPSEKIQSFRNSKLHCETTSIHAQELISNPLTSNPSKTLSEIQVQSFGESSNTSKLTAIDKLTSSSEEAITKRQVPGSSAPQSLELDDMAEEKRLKAQKCWVSLKEENNQLKEEISKVKLMLESCLDSESSPKQSVVVSNDSQELTNVYAGNIDNRCNIFSNNGKEENNNNDKEQELELRKQEDKSLKEDDLSVLEATVLHELVRNVGDSIVHSVKRELHNISDDVPCESSMQLNDCCIMSENIIDVKEESKDLRLSEPKKEAALGNVIVGRDLNMTSGSNDVKLPVIKVISPRVGRARSTSLDSGYTTPSPHLQVDSIQHHDNFQVGSVGEREYICANCPKEAKIYCTACSGTLYCSTECQTMHWYKTHNLECDGVPETNRGAMV